MKYNLSTIYRSLLFVLLGFTILSFQIFSATAQPMGKMNMDTSFMKQKDMPDMQNQTMLPMSFFTHMGMPLEVGTYGIRVAAVSTQNEGKSNIEYNFQLETGLSKTVGLFIGGEGLFEHPTLEAMVQFLVLKSKDGMSGFSPLIEFEFPLGKDAARSVYTLVGFATTLSTSDLAFNQVLHYSPLEDLIEGSASFVFKLTEKIFLVSEISGVGQSGERPILNLLGGVKVKLMENFFLGAAFQLPITNNREYSSRYVFQPNIMFNQ